jgi:hypothetical protein
MSTKQRVMVGFDFTGGNFPSALYTLQQWAAYASKSQVFTVSFGVSTASYGPLALPGTPGLTVRDALAVMRQYCQARMALP